MQAPEQRRTVTLDEVAVQLGIAESHVRKQIKRGTFPLPVIRIGRRVLISRDALDLLLSGDKENPGAAKEVRS